MPLSSGKGNAMNRQEMIEYATEYIARTRYGINDMYNVEMLDEYETVIECENCVYVAKYEPRETDTNFPKFEFAGIVKVRIIQGERYEYPVEMVMA